MPWLLNLAYATLIAAVFPFLLYRRVREGKYRTGWAEKLFGAAPDLPGCDERIWFHAVSVGEVLLLRGLISELRVRRPHVSIVLSTTTETGHDVARKHYPDLTVFYCPLDFSWAVRRAIGRIKPTTLVLAELELWPNLISAASQARVALAIVNGRLSEKSFKGYRRLRPLVSRLLARFDVIAAQSEEYAARFRALGAASFQVVTTGSVKYDGVKTDRANPQTAEIRRAFGLQDDEMVFIAGSTQDPEEEVAISTWIELSSEFPNLRLILVPRHRERFDDVARAIERRGFPLVRRNATLPRAERKDDVAKQSSERRQASDALSLKKPVLLLDTLGELGACWGLADVAFVGGSLTNRGGQNMIEPAAYGAAVLFGPNTRNFRDAVALLLTANAAKVVHDGAELTATVRNFLSDNALRSATGERARVAVAAHRGATSRTVDLLLSRVLDAGAGHPHRQAA